jgi:hypothetical protein
VLRLRHGSWPCLLLTLLVSACGLIGDKGNEPKGDQDLPVSGVGKFQKQDDYCQAEFVQPFFVLDAVGAVALSGEPCAITDGGSIRVWYESRRSDWRGVTLATKILTASLWLGPGSDCRDADAGLLAGSLQEIVFKVRDGENEVVLNPQPLAGAPTVVKVGGLYRMWFQIGDSQAIGYAETQNCTDQDCASWFLVRDDAGAVRERVLDPNQQWEAGSVGSPSVVLFNGVYRMWYDGDVDGNRAIGHAWSEDGLVWVKSDAAGNESTALGGAGGAVQPVLVATQTNWEFWYPDPSDPRHQGRVGTPCVIVHPTPARTLLLMYYTGNLRGRLQAPGFLVDPADSGLHMDASIGLAASEDGLTWQKAPSFSEPEVIADEINPIVAEKLPISIDPDRPAGSVNVFNPVFMVNEAAPAVLEVVPNQFFIMLWHQIDWANLYLTPSTPVPPATESGFPGGSGLGFAFTGNLPF